MTHTRAWQDGVLVAEDFPAEDVSDWVAKQGVLVWLDVEPTPDELRVVAAELGLDPHAVEDARTGQQRPKLDIYPNHSFLTVYATLLDPASWQLNTQEINAFITGNAVVTVRRGDPEAFDVAEMTDRWDEHADLIRLGVGALVWGLLDVVVDSHFEAVEALDDGLEELEDMLFGGPAGRTRDRALARRTFELRKSIVVLRRVALPMREVLLAVQRRREEVGGGHLDPLLAAYLGDVYDHVLRVSDWTEGLRDMVTTVFETNLAMQDHTLNTVVKKLTSWAAIIAVPTAVTGFYGQNVPYPGFARTSGFIVSTVIWVGLSVALYIGFRRRDWL